MKNNLNVLIVCAAGATSSVLVNILTEALKPEEHWTFEARSINDIQFTIGKYDCVLIAPQVAYQADRIEEIAKQYEDISVFKINANDFASQDGQRILKPLRKYYNQNAQDFRKGETNMSEKTSSNIMDKLSDWMGKYIVPVATKISNQRHLAAIRDGLSILIPVTIIGGFSCLLAIPPVPSSITEGTNIFYSFLLAWQSFATNYYSILITPYMLTISCISLYVVCGVSYRLAQSYKMDGMSNMISALVVYLCISGALDLSTSTLTISYLGASYMFGAMVIALLVVEITRMFDKYNIKITLPDSVPPNVAGPFNVLIALVFNVVFFILVDQLIISLTGAGFTSLVYTIFQPLMSASNTLPSILLLNFLSQLFWFFGIHGNNMMSAITSPITTAALAANAEAYAAGLELPYIYAGAMTSVYGGWLAGNTAMNLLLVLTAKSSRTRSLTKVAAISASFNIAEPYVYCLQEVLNF